MIVQSPSGTGKTAAFVLMFRPEIKMKYVVRGEERKMIRLHFKLDVFNSHFLAVVFFTKLLETMSLLNTFWLELLASFLNGDQNMVVLIFPRWKCWLLTTPI